MKGSKGVNSKLLKVIIAISVILICSYFLWDKVIFTVDSNLENLINDKEDKDYYESVTSKFNKKSIAVKYAKLQIENILDEDNNLGYFNDNLTIQSISWGKSGRTISKGSIEKINEDYIVIKKNNKDSDELGEYEIGVSILKWFGGDALRGIDILENIDYLKNNELKTIRNLNLAAMYIGMSKFEEAEKLLVEEFKENNNYNYFKRDLLSYIYFLRGENDRFKEATSYGYQTLSYEGNGITGIKYDEDERYKVRSNLKSEIKTLSPYLKLFNGLEDIFQSIEYNNELYANSSETKNTLSGYIKYNGKPLRGVIVYLKDSKDTGMSSGGFVDSGIYGMTDESGRYEIKNIPDGNYNIGLNGSWQQLKSKQIKLKKKHITFSGYTMKVENIQLFDPIRVNEFEYIDKEKIKVSWENPMGDGFEYSVKFGEIQNREDGGEDVSYSYINSISTKENFVVIDLEELKKTSVGNIYSWGNALVDPYQVIEPFYHEGKYGLVIDAYMENSDYFTPGSNNYGVYSNRPYDSIYIEGKEWNEGDRLLLNKEYTKALDWFENELNENPENLHAMKILSTIYSKGYKGQEKIRGLIGKDIKKGIKYTESLQERIGETHYVLFTLADLYNSDDQYERAIEYYLKRVELEEVSYEYRLIGNMYMKMGRWNEALKYYKLYCDDYSNSHYSDVLLISVLMDNKEEIEKYSKVLESKEYGLDYSQLFREYINMNREKYSKLYNLIRQEKIAEAKEMIFKDDSDIGIFYKGLLILSEKLRFEDKEEESYYKLYTLQQDKTLKSLMKYFGQNEIVSSFGEPWYDIKNN